jgi:hypothetical protein
MGRWSSASRSPTVPRPWSPHSASTCRGATRRGGGPDPAPLPHPIAPTDRSHSTISIGEMYPTPTRPVARQDLLPRRTSVSLPGGVSQGRLRHRYAIADATLGPPTRSQVLAAIGKEADRARPHPSAGRSKSTSCRHRPMQVRTRRSVGLGGPFRSVAVSVAVAGRYRAGVGVVLCRVRRRGC